MNEILVSFVTMHMWGRIKIHFFCRRWVNALLFILSFFCIQPCFSQNQKEIVYIEQEIENGELWNAEHRLLQLKKTYSKNEKDAYYSNKLLCKIYCIEQDFIHYKGSTDELVKLAKRMEPIYLSEAYAHKAYYWHFMMWEDSALYYSNLSFDLLDKHRGDFQKIDPAFVYEVYAITYLYRRNDLKINAYKGLGLQDYQRKQFFYFDSCEIIQKKYPFKFSSEKAMFYRSYGNRNLDIVSSYRVCTKEETKTFSARQWYGSHRANQLYNKGLKCIKPCHKNDFLALTSLKALNFTLIGEWKMAEQIFDHVYQTISVKELMNRKHVSFSALKVFLSFKIRNAILLPYHKQSVDRDIAMLHQLKKEFWSSFFTNCELPYDPYKISPYIDLFSLYYFKSLNEKKHATELMYKAVSYLLTMKSYFHFLQTGLHKSLHELPYFHVSSIQKNLKVDEGYLLFQNDADFLKDKKILILRDQIKMVNVKHRPTLEVEKLDSVSIRKFKYQSYQDFKLNFRDIRQQAPAIKKIFICYDDPNPYEIFIKDIRGKHYDKLNYLGNEINFVRIYNPVTYFKSPKRINFSRMDVRYLEQQKSSHLLFSNDYFSQADAFPKYSFSSYRGGLKDLLSKGGMLHLYGHGELSLDSTTNHKSFEWSYLKNDKLQRVQRISGDFTVSRDLVVLNQCFSGYPDFDINEFNKTIPLRILSNGAKAVISSPSLVDDYYSAEFFKSFYKKIMNHKVFEDAFYESRKEFFENHPELSNPRYWNGLQLIQSYSLQYESKMPFKLFLLFMVISCTDLILSLLSVRMKKMQSIDL